VDGMVLEDGSLPEEFLSLIYLPLLAQARVLGIITIQSLQKNAYTDYHLNLLQNLAVYIFGGQQVAFPETIKQELYHFGPITIGSVQIFIWRWHHADGRALLFIEHTKMARHPSHRRKS
jgi:branched-subunit amino acid ABC-type transport system permease component